MIKVEMHGRLGNQMFQYATARRLQEKTRQKLLFSFREVLNEKDKEGDTGWKDDLKYLNVKPYSVYKGKHSLLFFKSSLRQIVVTLIFYLNYKPILIKKPYDFTAIYNKQIKWAKLLNRYGIWWLKLGYYPFNNRYKGNYLLNGGFESSSFFDDIKPKLISEFTPKIPLNEKQNNMISRLKNCNSVCLSIRHFVLKDKEENQIFNVCDKNYYLRAIAEIYKRVEKPIFYICSDDQKWVKNTFNFSNQDVIFEDETDKPWIKLYIMTKCHNFIIPNSTFSWWAQYLSTYSNKIVIGPARWYNISNYKSPLIEDSWIKI